MADGVQAGGQGPGVAGRVFDGEGQADKDFPVAQGALQPFLPGLPGHAHNCFAQPQTLAAEIQRRLIGKDQVLVEVQDQGRVGEVLQEGAKPLTRQDVRQGQRGRGRDRRPLGLVTGLHSC